MKILALVGSPRKEGNTDILVEQILQGSKTKGHTSEKLYLYKYKISPCVDCRNCKKGDYVCTAKDEMQEIYPKMEKADVIIFGTPLYFWGPTGQMKALMDRMRPFGTNGRLKGKKAVVVAPSVDGPKLCGPLLEMFRLTFDHLGVGFIGNILAQAFEKGEIGQNQEALKEAHEFGASL